MIYVGEGLLQIFRRRKWKLSWKMYQQGKDWIHYSSCILLNIRKLLKPMSLRYSFIFLLPKFFLTLLHFFFVLVWFFCWLFSASKRRLYWAFVYGFLHISCKRTVSWMEIHMLDSYSVWHILRHSLGNKRNGILNTHQY
jgi:hypothetical protein